MKFILVKWESSGHLKVPGSALLWGVLCWHSPKWTILFRMVITLNVWYIFEQDYSTPLQNSTAVQNCLFPYQHDYQYVLWGILSNLIDLFIFSQILLISGLLREDWRLLSWLQRSIILSFNVKVFIIILNELHSFCKAFWEAHSVLLQLLSYAKPGWFQQENIQCLE